MNAHSPDDSSFNKVLAVLLHPIDSAVEAVEEDRHSSALLLTVLMILILTLYQGLVANATGMKGGTADFGAETWGLVAIILSVVSVIGLYLYSWLYAFPLRLFGGRITSRQFRIVSGWICGPLILCCAIGCILAVSELANLSIIPAAIAAIIWVVVIVRTIAATAELSIIRTILAYLFIPFIFAIVSILVISFLGSSTSERKESVTVSRKPNDLRSLNSQIDKYLSASTTESDRADVVAELEIQLENYINDTAMPGSDAVASETDIRQGLQFKAADHLFEGEVKEGDHALYVHGRGARYIIEGQVVILLAFCSDHDCGAVRRLQAVTGTLEEPIPGRINSAIRALKDDKSCNLTSQKRVECRGVNREGKTSIFTFEVRSR